MSTGISPFTYTSITNRIVAALEAGVLPWHRPWRSQLPCNAVSGAAYRGVNSLLLGLTAIERGYESSQWVTYRQAQRLGGHVRKGERATHVVWWEAPAPHGAADDDEDSEPRSHRYWLARTHPVFNVAQVDGLASPPPATTAPTPAAEAFDAALGSYGADVRHGSNRAYYSPTGDYIAMPPRDSFDPPDTYYGTLAHELVHHSGAPHRLGRDLSGRFGSQAYAVEELVAELGSAFLTGRLGIAHEPQSSASYIASWLAVLRADSRTVFTTARMAQEAADYFFSGHDGPQGPEGLVAATSCDTGTGSTPSFTPSHRIHG
jgi:antirestriction protein ArdC